MAQLDVRPPRLDLTLYKGNAHTVVADFGSSVAGRTFAARFLTGATPLTKTVTPSGNTATFTVTEADTAAALASSQTWEFVETTGGADQVLFGGVAGVSNRPSGAPTSTTVTVAASSSTITVQTVGPPGPQGNPGTNGTNGTDGEDGTDGASILAGAGGPGAGLGNTGDLYVDVATGDLYRKEL